MGRAEAIVEKYLDDEVEKLGGFTRKWKGQCGEPDRIIFLPGGVVWFIEVKTLNESPRPKQKGVISRIVQTGANACHVSGKHGVDQFIKRLKNNV